MNQMHFLSPIVRVLVLCCLAMLVILPCGCAATKTPAESSSGGTTGYAPGTVQQPCIYLNGQVYDQSGEAAATNEQATTYIKDHQLVKIGVVLSEDNSTLPVKDWAAGRVAVDTPVYQGKEKNTLYLHRADGRLLIFTPKA